jgi:hypothetical protein
VLLGRPSCFVRCSDDRHRSVCFAGFRHRLPSGKTFVPFNELSFHFVLTHFHFTGFESEFDDLKRFICSGTGANRARIVEEVILPELVPEEARLRQWSHILTAEFNRDGFFSRMQFFAGPRLKPFVWRVDLGANPSRVLPEMAQGLRFYYYEHPIHLAIPVASKNLGWAQRC